MTELRDRFRTLDRVDVPDLAEEVRRRAEEPRTPARGGRVVAALLAFVLSAATLAFLAFAFRAKEHVPLAAETAEIDAIVEGVRVRWPSSWTLVRLSERSPDTSRWPMFQLTNFDPGLEPGALCPFTAELPADGVVLYVQRDLKPIAETYDEWPVELTEDDVSDIGCDRQMTTAWTVDGHWFQASLAFGPDASEQDRAKLLQVFADLLVVDPTTAGSGRRMDEHFRNTWYVVWGVRSDDPELATAYLVGDDANEPLPSRVLATSGGIGLGWSRFDPDPPFAGLGDAKQPDRPFVQSWGVASNEVRRIVLDANDGRQIELTIGPSLLRFGLPARPTYVEFEPPLVGEYVALDVSGNVLGRVRERNWPPGTAVPSPSPSPSPQEAEVRLPDAEAKADRQAIEAEIDGPVLMRGNNWNYPWAVYLASDGKITYLDADSVSPMERERPQDAFWGTRFSLPPDPEVLFVGVASDRVDRLGVERADGTWIAGRIAHVPASNELVVSVTVDHPRVGDRLVARDSTGQTLQVEPLEGNEP